MTKPRETPAGSLRIAAALLVVSGILHGLNWIVAGWSQDSLVLVCFGVLYLVLGLLLSRGVAGTRYVAVLSVAVGGVGAYVMIHVLAVPEWLTQILIAFDIAIFALLFAGLWRDWNASRA